MMFMSFLIRKFSGETEEFSPEKVREAVRRSGANQKTTDEIVKEVEGKLYDGITTKEIYGLAFKLLEKKEPITATKFGLKNALMRLGPSGFPFEKYVAAILREHGYKVELNQKIRGFCVEHEIDLVVEDSHGKSIVECKYHNSPGFYTGLKPALYTYARFQDLNDAGHKFYGVWLVTNTKSSSEARKYARCKNMKIIGWNHPSKGSLQELIEEKRLYPITILRSVDKKAKDRFAGAGLMLAKDLLKHERKGLSTKTGLSGKKLDNIFAEVEGICLC